jgi:hypothetical protein
VHIKISQPLLCKILKNRSDIETSALTNENTDRKRARLGKDSQVESALKIWFNNVREKNALINGPLMRQNAEELAKTMGKEKFSATDGWFNRWKKRENFVYKRMHGAERSADFLAADKSKLAKSESNCTSKEEKILEAPPTNAQMREALQILCLGVQHRGTNFQRHYEYEQFIQELLNANKQQATRHKFFK